MIKTFSISIPDPDIEALKARLKLTRWPDEIQNAGWNYGADLSYVKALAHYWLNEYDWKKTEKVINSYPNYIAEINGIKIHFLHIKSKAKNPVPILITHGWPGSVLEMLKLIPILESDPELSFDIIIPSIPGFGFSEKINIPGCDLWFIAELWSRLIRELGYSKVLLHGGDFGSGINTALGLKHPEQILGLHLNYIHSSYLPYLDGNETFSEAENSYFKAAEEWYKYEGAYAHQHRTKPLTLAYGLNDSPIGLCAWIIEKFYDWSDCNKDLESVFTKDELLSNISLYWFTGTIHSSVRLYNETIKTPLHFNKSDFVAIPTGIIRFQKEEPFPPRRFIERGYNIQHWTEIPKGGHFAAMEQPALLAADIIKFTQTVLIKQRK
jgi:pimeloyl-ACP methyl ester carboxylesterase